MDRDVLRVGKLPVTGEVESAAPPECVLSSSLVYCNSLDEL